MAQKEVTRKRALPRKRIVTNTLPRNARSQSCSVANANSLMAVIRKTAPIGAKVAVRPAVPKQKKAQPPGIRIKAPKRKKKIRARAVIDSSPFKGCLWTRQEPGSRITKTWLQSQEKPRLEAPIWVC